MIENEGAFIIVDFETLKLLQEVQKRHALFVGSVYLSNNYMIKEALTEYLKKKN